MTHKSLQEDFEYFDTKKVRTKQVFLLKLFIILFFLFLQIFMFYCNKQSDIKQKKIEEKIKCLAAEMKNEI